MGEFRKSVEFIAGILGKSFLNYGKIFTDVNRLCYIFNLFSC